MSFTKTKRLNLEFLYASNDWFSVEGSLQLLKLDKNYNRHELIHSYISMAYKYHPANPLHRHHKERFIQIYLAYDLLLFLVDFTSDSPRSKEEIFKIWLNEDKAYAIDMALKLCRLNKKQFEKLLFKGFNKAIQAIYWFFTMLLLFSIVYPLRMFIEGEIGLESFLLISLCYPVPSFLLVRQIIKEEDELIQSVKEFKNNRSRYKQKYTKPSFGIEAKKLKS